MLIPTVALVMRFASADLERQKGSISIRPAGTYVYEDTEGVPFTIVDSPVRAAVGELDAATVRIIPSDAPGWRTDRPVPYRVTETAYGARRSYTVFVTDDGSGTFDLVSAPKYPVPDSPPAPQILLRLAPPDPHAYGMVEVCGRYAMCNASHAEGAVIFRPIFPVELGGADPAVITRSPVVVTSLIEGAFALELIPSNSPDWLVPEPVMYRIMEKISGTNTAWCTMIDDRPSIDLSDLRTGTPCTSTVMARR